MTRLIDAEELKEYLEEAYEAGCIEKYYNQQRRSIFDEVFDCIDKQPTVDAVRVIRCKDCKFHHDRTQCSKRIGAWFDDDYCNGAVSAERKEE